MGYFLSLRIAFHKPQQAEGYEKMLRIFGIPLGYETQFEQSEFLKLSSKNQPPPVRGVGGGWFSGSSIFHPSVNGGKLRF